MISYLQYKENGFAVIENFLSEKEADEMNKIGLDMAKNAPENIRKIVHSSKKPITFEKPIGNINLDSFLFFD